MLLHAGVADRRAWDGVAAPLGADDLDVIAYDRRGFGDSLPVGNSMGGAIALDTALLHPSRVTGVLLIGAAVSGMTDDDTSFDWVADSESPPAHGAGGGWSSPISSPRWCARPSAADPAGCSHTARCLAGRRGVSGV